jgi:hypothetical protein
MLPRISQRTGNHIGINSHDSTVAGSLARTAYETFGGTLDVVSAKTGALLTEIPTVGAGEQSAAGWLDGGPVLMVAAGPRFGPLWWARVGKPRPPAQIGIWQPGDTTLRVVTDKNAAEIR